MKGKWEKSSWGRKLIVQKRRAALNDFNRFKVMLARIKVGNLPAKGLISAPAIFLVPFLHPVSSCVCTERWCYQARARQAQEGLHGIGWLTGLPFEFLVSCRINNRFQCLKPELVRLFHVPILNLRSMDVP